MCVLFLYEHDVCKFCVFRFLVMLLCLLCVCVFVVVWELFLSLCDVCVVRICGLFCVFSVWVVCV